ncbi:MAG: PAS domain S-box protein [Gammaproteobacteria bacterium]|nr:PAS domain S-box protein [Gammaproteobacteria bacterium]
MKIKQIIWVYIVGFTLASLVVVYTANSNLNSSRTIQLHWQQFHQDSSIKDGALNTIFHNIGVSGAINFYKLYILQGDPRLPIHIRTTLSNANGAIDRYQSQPTSREEDAALNQLRQTLSLYDQNITYIEHMLAQGYSAKEIDSRVRIDDGPALKALHTLTSTAPTYVSTEEAKAHILNRLRRTLGYGGITHHIYNYLLRGERLDRDATWSSIREANHILGEYQARARTEPEIEALDTLQEIIMVYAERLGTIEQQKNANALSASEITHLFVADREAMLSALSQLEQGIFIDNGKAAQQLQKTLVAITVSSQLMLYLTITFTVLLILSLFWFINNRIVVPINTLSLITDRLSHDDTSVTVPLTEQTNEIGLLARSIDVFKKNILLRQHAEEKLKHINLNLEGQIKEGTQQVDFYSRHMKNLLENAADAIISADKNGMILSFNKAACDTFGYSMDEIQGKNVSLLMPNPHAVRHDQYLHNYFNSGKAKIMGIGRELYGKRKSGEEFPIDVALTTLKDNGKTYITAFIRDITLHKEQEKKLRQAQKMDALGQLTGGIAHDYNNMLGVIIGFSELLDNELESSSTAKQYADEIHHAAKRGSKLTEKLLGFSRNQGSEPELVDINQILAEQQHMLEKALMVDIKLSMSFSEQACLAWIDPGEWEDALLNMSINAMHAMTNGGELRIETDIVSTPSIITNPTSTNYILITLKDTGMGIPAAMQHRIFDPFFSTKGEKGTGLGLSQVYGFIQRSLGHIELESTAGHGTTFRIYLPVYEVDDVYPDKPVMKHSTGEFSGNESILLVDDEPSLLILISEMLQPHGYKVTTACSAAEAQGLLQQNEFQLVVSDIIMPDMNGYKLAEWIYIHHPQCKIQLTSGFDHYGKHQEVDETLKQNILKKPFTSSELLKTIRERLDEE